MWYRLSGPRIFRIESYSPMFPNSVHYKNNPGEARLKYDKTSEHFIHCEPGFTFNKENSKDVRTQRPM